MLYLVFSNYQCLSIVLYIIYIHILFDEMDRGLGHEKKMFDTTYFNSFLKKLLLIT